MTILIGAIHCPTLSSQIRFKYAWEITLASAFPIYWLILLNSQKPSEELRVRMTEIPYYRISQITSLITLFLFYWSFSTITNYNNRTNKHWATVVRKHDPLPVVLLRETWTQCQWHAGICESLSWCLADAEILRTGSAPMLRLCLNSSGYWTWTDKTRRKHPKRNKWNDIFKKALLNSFLCEFLQPTTHFIHHWTLDVL